MQLGSLAFTILVFWKIWVLMAHHVGLCKRLHQEALENVFEDGDCRCTLLKTRRYPPFKLPHFWSWRCWPKIQRWSFGFADSTSLSGEISVTRKRFQTVQTKIHLATDNVSWFFLGILYCSTKLWMFFQKECHGHLRPSLFSRLAELALLLSPDDGHNSNAALRIRSASEGN